MVLGFCDIASRLDWVGLGSGGCRGGAVECRYDSRKKLLQFTYPRPGSFFLAFSIRDKKATRRTSVFQTGYSLFKMSPLDLVNWYSSFC